MKGFFREEDIWTDTKYGNVIFCIRETHFLCKEEHDLYTVLIVISTKS